MSRHRVVVLVLLASIVSVVSSPQASRPRQGCLPPPSGLTNWWPGDGNRADIVGGLDARFWVEEEYGDGLVGEAFATGGEKGNFVYVDHDPALNFGVGDFTVSLWVNLNSNIAEQVLIEKYIQTFENPEPPPPGWTLTKLATNEIGFVPGVEDSGVLPILYAERYGERAWTHFAARRQGSRTTIFMNGEIISQSTAPAVDADSTSSLKFGHRGNPTDTQGSEDDRGFFLNGLIDEVQLYVGRALPDGTIQSIYQAGSAGVCKP